jgi:hypothetical protein
MTTLVANSFEGGVQGATVTTGNSGTAPDNAFNAVTIGNHYDDPNVPWTSYFHGGDVVHGFVRSGYGYPQSLGCVDLSLAAAATAWHDMPYGMLVTVGPKVPTSDPYLSQTEPQPRSNRRSR